MPKEVYCDTSDLEKKIKEVGEALSPAEMRSALSRSLNHTLNFIGAETKRQVKDEYYVTKSLNKSVKKVKATRSNLTAEAWYTGKPLPLFIFKNQAPDNVYRSPVSVIVKKANGWQEHTGSAPAMFRAYGKKIKLRNPRERKIHGAYTLSIPQMVSSDDVYDEIAKKAEKHLSERTAHEIKEALRKRWL